MIYKSHININRDVLFEDKMSDILIEHYKIHVKYFLLIFWLTYDILVNLCYCVRHYLIQCPDVAQTRFQVTMASVEAIRHVLD